ncbi:MAG: cytochrome c-type biogenesis protein CcmH [Polyangiaceae bacterium]|nr:cytochrome c-type biogenesis protein CcmH [Polyangiaceae bacterium]
MVNRRLTQFVWCVPWLGASVLASLPAVAGGGEPVSPPASAAEQEKYLPGQHRLEGELIAPCCWNQTMDIHNSPIVSDLRREIRRRLTAGESVDAIRSAMVERYGSKILAVQPHSPLRGFAVGLTVLIGLAGVGAGLKLRKWRAAAIARSAEPSPSGASASAETSKDKETANAALDARLDGELRDLES